MLLISFILQFQYLQHVTDFLKSHHKYYASFLKILIICYTILMKWSQWEMMVLFCFVLFFSNLTPCELPADWSKWVYRHILNQLGNVLEKIVSYASFWCSVIKLYCDWFNNDNFIILTNQKVYVQYGTISKKTENRVLAGFGNFSYNVQNFFFVE